MSVSVQAASATRAAASSRRRGRNYARVYWPFILPAGIVVAAVIVVPWIFTLFVSTQDWRVGSARTFAGLDNYIALFADERFLGAIWRTLYFTVLAVIFPVVLGVAAAVCFHKRFLLRGLLRTIFVLPMMAPPVAVALVWVMMLHPDLGVVNWLLGSLGLPTPLWVYGASTVIPTLVVVETWQWTPLIMLIVLGGLASLPADPYEAATLDGASAWQSFWTITMPLVWPHVLVATVIRTIDAVKAFDLIFVMSNGGPGTASETLNLYLYQQAFANYNIGYAGALTVIFFLIVLLISTGLFTARKAT